MRTINVTVGGKSFSFPASNNILRRAQAFSGVNAPQELAECAAYERMPTVDFLQGILAAGIERCTDAKIEPGKEADYFEEIGERWAFDELDSATTAIMCALNPEIEQKIEEAKAKAEAEAEKGRAKNASSEKSEAGQESAG